MRETSDNVEQLKMELAMEKLPVYTGGMHFHDVKSIVFEEPRLSDSRTNVYWVAKLRIQAGKCNMDFTLFADTQEKLMVKMEAARGLV